MFSKKIPAAKMIAALIAIFLIARTIDSAGTRSSWAARCPVRTKSGSPKD